MNQTNQITHHDGARAFGWCNVNIPTSERTYLRGRVNDGGYWVEEASADRQEVVSAFQRLDNHEAAKRAGVFVGLFLASAAIVAAIIWLLVEVM